ncbi:MAG: lipA [Chlamydiia bacterium]|nr:lipA [Chlamydiia bacterium]
MKAEELFESSLKIVQQNRLPSWLHRKLPKGNALFQTGETIKQHKLHTVCEEAKCPNLLECYSKKTATFLVMGKECTRACGFCDIDFSKAPKALDANEPYEVAESVKKLGLKHVVITMVARDDLQDGGARHLAHVITAIRKECVGTTIEVLTSDFDGNQEALTLILKEKPEIFNHNIETVRSLTHRVRFKATYERSLATLSYVKKENPEQLVKSGIMLGLGESKEEVITTLKDLLAAGCDIVTMGQYLQASKKKLAVKEYIHPDMFKEYELIGLDLGIKYMYTGPFVRSSYNANLVLNNTIINSH